MSAYLLRKDWRARRRVIVLWILLLAVCVGVQLFPLDSGADPTRQGVSMLFLILLPFACLMLLLGVVGPTVGEDSPARRERFLATRPLPARALWISKALFLGLVVILPVIVLSAGFLALATHDLRITLLGTLQMTLLALAITLFIAGFGSMWSSKVQTVLGLVTVGAVFFAFGFLGVKWLPRGWFDGLASTHPLESTTGLLVAGLLLCGLVTWRRFLHSPLWQRLGALAVVTLVGLLVASFLPAIQGEDAPWDEVEKLAPGETKHRLSWSDGPALHLRLSIDRPDHLAPEEDISWLWTRTRVNGETYENPFHHRMALGSFWSFEDRYEESLRRQVETRLGKDVSWVLFNRHRVSFATGGAAQCEFHHLDPGAPEAVDLEVALRATVYRWECEAELPLVPGSDSKSDDVAWSVSGAFGPEDPRLGTQILLEQRGPILWLSEEEGERTRPVHARSRQRTYLLHDPKRGRVFIGLSVSSQGQGFLPIGYPGMRVALRVSGDGRADGLLRESWPDLKLLIFRPRIVESFDRRWAPPRAVVPAHVPKPRAHGADSPRSLTAGEFSRKYQLLAKPTGGADEVGRFLDEVIHLASECDASIDGAREPWVRDLARLVPDHLDAFLKRFGRLDVNDYRARRLLLGVMKHGCLDTQAEAVAEALADDLELLPLVLFRGWLGEARGVLLEQFDYGIRSYDSLEALDRLGAFEDPARREALLADLRFEADMTAYQILRRIDGMDERLDETIARLGGDSPDFLPGMLTDADRRFELPLAHGRREAVAELHRVTRSLPMEEHRTAGYEVQQLLDTYFEHREITGTQRHDGKSLIRWFLEREPEDFRFDPISRRFVWQKP